MGRITILTNADDPAPRDVTDPDSYLTEDDWAAIRRQEDEEAAKPRLHPGELYQVRDGAGTWHAAAVGPGILCADVQQPTQEWTYGTDRVDCPELGCSMALGRR